jgi:hypothetical protein
LSTTDPWDVGHPKWVSWKRTEEQFEKVNGLAQAVAVRAKHPKSVRI